MSGVLLLLVSIVLFITAYHTYGSWLVKKFGLDNKIKTPAHTHGDGVDFVPSNKWVLLGHHFASIAGVGPILGPVLGAAYGWLPVIIWLVVGNVFIGAVHDFGSLVVSMRNKGKSIGAVIEDYLGAPAKNVFMIFIWFALVLILGVFAIVVANTLVAHPEVATSSILFIAAAVFIGYMMYVKKMPLLWATIIGLILIAVSITLGMKYPLSMSYNSWIIILLVYAVIASITPVWILLQPRDYLNSFLLYVILIGGVLGVIFYRPDISIPAFISFDNEKLGPMFPILFVTVACGAISGFHSVVSSGTTSKQITQEKDAKFIGYGGMLIEGVLGVIALITAAMLTTKGYGEALAGGGPISLFSNGIGNLMSKLGIPLSAGVSFAALAISAFALTTLDTTSRLARYTFQEFFESAGNSKILTNKVVATIVTVVAAGILAFNKGGTMAIWPLFGSANQMLASLALLTVSAYLAHKAEDNMFIMIPTGIMFVITISAMSGLIYKNISTGNWPLVIIGAILLISAAYVIVTAMKSGRKTRIRN